MAKRKKTSLDTLSLAVDPAPKKVKPKKPDKQPTKPAEAVQEKQAPDKRPPTKQSTLYLTHPVRRQIGRLAADEDKKQHTLFLEAIDLLFADRGLPSIAELEEEEEGK